MIGNPDSLVQIMPVSFRNENGMPETINVVITVPPSEATESGNLEMVGPMKAGRRSNEVR